MVQNRDKNAVGGGARAPGGVDGVRAFGLRVAYAVVALAGVGASIELIRLHVKAHTQPMSRSFCSVHAKVDCLTVAESPYAVFLHVPVAVWATLAFGVLLVGSAVLAYRQRPKAGGRDALAGVTLLLSLASVAVSAVMAYLSHFVIGSLCLVCAGLYVVSLALAVIGWRIARRHGGFGAAVRADLRLLRRRPWPLLGVGGALLMVAGLLIWHYPAYWVLREPVGPGGLPHGVTREGHFWLGARTPALVIHEFSDYQCGFCRMRNARLRQILRKPEFRDRVRLVHHNYPLDRRCNPTVPREFHLRACELARGAVCAGEQGKFWEMNDLLFRRQGRRGGPSLLGLAGKLDLDLPRFRACLEAPRTRQRVRADIDQGERWARQVTGSGIRGTPTYFFEQPGEALRLGAPVEAALREALERVPVQRGPAGRPHGVTPEGDPWIGARKPALVLFEVSDYQCYFCRRAHFRLRDLLSQPPFAKAVRLVHLHYPFDKACNPAFETRQHPRACAFARLAVCAQEQGKFWEVSDLLYRRGKAGRPASLERLGVEAGLDRERLRACLGGAESKERLSASIARAEALGQRDRQGIDGIPIVFAQLRGRAIQRLGPRVTRQRLLQLLRESARPAAGQRLRSSGEAAPGSPRAGGRPPDPARPAGSARTGEPSDAPRPAARVGPAPRSGSVL